MAQRKTKKSLTIFVTTFVFTLFFISFVFKVLGPNVDVQIGDSSYSSQGVDREEQDEVTNSVDKRLRMIQMEDNQDGMKDNTKSQGEEKSISDQIKDAASEEAMLFDEEYVSPQGVKNEGVKSSSVTSVNHNDEDVVRDDDRHNYKQVPRNLAVTGSVDGHKQQTSQQNTHSNNIGSKHISAKVYIGHYSDINQAIAVQNQLAQSDVSVVPFIKQRSGQYIIQAGSFSSKQQAQRLVNELSQAGIDSYIVEE